MPGSPTAPGRPDACDGAPVRLAFRGEKRVGARDIGYFAAPWLACALPCRRFADVLADACARLAADVDRYSFIAVDFHHLLLAGLPAHSHSTVNRGTLGRAAQPDRLGRRAMAAPKALTRPV